MAIKIYDAAGDEQDREWLAAKYGDLLILANPAPAAWRVVELHERVGPAVLLVETRDESGSGVAGVKVARTWGPDVASGIYAAELKPLPEELAEWWPVGVHGPTEAAGVIGFGMGTGDYYTPENNGRGASGVCCQGPSDGVIGLGMLPETVHSCLMTVFQWCESGNGGDGEPLDMIAEGLDLVSDGFAKLAGAARAAAEVGW